jgi:hypothetical protein
MCVSDTAIFRPNIGEVLYDPLRNRGALLRPHNVNDTLGSSEITWAEFPPAAGPAIRQ